MKLLKAAVKGKGCQSREEAYLLPEKKQFKILFTEPDREALGANSIWVRKTQVLYFLDYEGAEEAFLQIVKDRNLMIIPIRIEPTKN